MKSTHDADTEPRTYWIDLALAFAGGAIAIVAALLAR